MAPFEVPLVLPSPVTTHEQTEQRKATVFVEHLHKLHTQVSEILAKSQAKYKALQDRHRIQHHLQVGDKVWLHLDKQRFKTQSHHKLKSLRYGPYTILEAIGPNAFRLDLPAQLGIHNVINVNNLKLYEPPQLEDEIAVLHPDDNIPDFQPPLVEDTLLDTRTRTTRNRQIMTYLVGKKGSLPLQAKWFSQATMDRDFPHLLRS